MAEVSASYPFCCRYPGRALCPFFSMMYMVVLPFRSGFPFSVSSCHAVNVVGFARPLVIFLVKLVR